MPENNLDFWHWIYHDTFIDSALGLWFAEHLFPGYHYGWCPYGLDESPLKQYIDEDSFAEFMRGILQ